MATHEEDLFDYFFNPEGLPDFIGQEFAALTGSLPSSVGTGFSDLNFAFSEELEEEGDMLIGAESASPASGGLPSPASLLATLNNTLTSHAHALLTEVKEEVFSPGQSSDSGGYGEEEEFERGEVAIKGEDVLSLSKLPSSPSLSPTMAASTPVVAMAVTPTIATFDNFEADSNVTNGNGKQRKQRKRQRVESASTVRLIKNRESAQKSRQRRKLYIEELERKVTHITAQNERLTQENKMLRDDLVDIMSRSSPQSSTSSSPLDVPLDLTITNELGCAKKLTAPPRNMKAAGLCLVIVLFSFGLLFNSKNAYHNGVPAPINMGPLYDIPMPEVIPALSDRQTQYPANRVLNKPAGETTVITTAASKPKLLTAAAGTLAPKRTPPQQQQQQQQQLTSSLKRTRSGLPKPSSPAATPNTTQSAAPLTPPPSAPQQQQKATQPSVGQKTYLFCAEAREVVMTQEDAGCVTTNTHINNNNDNSNTTHNSAPLTTTTTTTAHTTTSEPSMVSLLIPMDGFNGTEETEDGRGQGVLSLELQKLVAANRQPQLQLARNNATSTSGGGAGGVPSLIEVSCQIMSMNVYSPFLPAASTLSI
eukprot:TRINITY_DN6808_c1_g1_i1.p1 TRINITY_DN6808_c1_g1~~TRINITY_DN6808_c1_g1_i1.p1  ORF type:complete len:592 (+),score=188.08 TRINITY_DN6808_c1_g1_i1:145-1920(+)